jgi:hypothetical protein
LLDFEDRDTAQRVRGSARYRQPAFPLSRMTAYSGLHEYASAVSRFYSDTPLRLSSLPLERIAAFTQKRIRGMPLILFFVFPL